MKYCPGINRGLTQVNEKKDAAVSQTASFLSKCTIFFYINPVLRNIFAPEWIDK